MSSNDLLNPFYFQSGQAFPDEIVMRDTLRAGCRGHETHVPREMLPVLTSIVLTYNNKFKQQEENFQMQLHDLYHKIFALQSQLNFLADHPGERL